MKFIECKEGVPERSKSHKKLKIYFDEFMNTNIKVAKIELKEGEYKNIDVARSVLYTSIKNWGFPIDIHLRNGVLYLERRDI